MYSTIIIRASRRTRNENTLALASVLSFRPFWCLREPTVVRSRAGGTVAIGPSFITLLYSRRLSSVSLSLSFPLLAHLEAHTMTRAHSPLTHTREREREGAFACARARARESEDTPSHSHTIYIHAHVHAPLFRSSTGILRHSVSRISNYRAGNHRISASR